MKTNKLCKFLVVFTALIFSFGVVMAQNVTITGTVTSSDDGLPIPGASVVQKGTTLGVSTDANGLYKISVPKGATLQISFMGMTTQEFVVGDQTVINAELQSSMYAMDEVVVTALGITREKKSLGYSVTEVKGDKLTAGPSASPVSALQGLSTGLLITNTDGGVFGGTRINIRGNSTLRGNNQPIFIVDGVAIDNEVSGGSQWGGSDWGNNLKNLNPDDFESVSVLKGSAATALYGSRAIFGVILITTKKGKASKGIGLEITQTTAFEVPYAGQDFQNEYGVGGIAGYCTELTDRFAPQDYFALNGDGEKTVYLGDWGAWSWGPKMEGQLIRDYNDTWTKFSPHPDNMLAAFNTGVQNNTNVALTGSSGGTNYYVSFSHKDQNGIFPGNKTVRNSIAVNIGQQMNKWLKLDANIAYVTSDNQNPPSRAMYSEFIYSTFPRSFDTEKFYKKYKASHGGTPNYDYGDENWRVPGNSLWYSIFEDKNTSIEDNTRVRLGVTANLTPWLTAKIGGDYNQYTTETEYKQPGQGYMNAGGYYLIAHQRKFQNSIDGQLIATKEIFPDLTATVIAGAERFYTVSSYTRSNTTNGLDPVNVFAITSSIGTVSSEAWRGAEKILASAYYIANFDYKGQYFLDVTGRNDWSSAMVYPDKTGHMSYFYPSFTGSWVFSETFTLPTWFDFGKARLAYAIVGNSADPYMITNPNTYTKDPNSINSLNGSIPRYDYTTTSVYNPNIQPEKKHEFEIGLDVRFFQNRLGLDFTYYNNHTKNQILSNAVPYQSGVTSIMFNAGDIQNKGIELTLHTTPVRTSNVTWDIDFNYTRNRNKIIDLYPGIDLYNLYESGTYGNTRIGTYAYVGKEWGVLMSDSAPLMDEASNTPILRWSSGNRGVLYYRNNTLQKVGSMAPHWFGSINSSLTVKNFMLNFLIDGKIGGQISSYHGRYGAGTGVFESSLKGRDEEHGGITWTSPWTGGTYHDGIVPAGVFVAGQTIQMKDSGGTTNTYDVGGMTYQQAIDAGYAEPSHVSYTEYQINSWSNGVINKNVLMEDSYICMREVSLGYRIPANITEKIGARGINVLVYGRNLGYLYNTMTNHLNPEVQTSNEAGAAHEWMQSPYSRTFGFKLNLNF
jgi:iron complex outermembrane recepter protein